ncbi:MAG: phosphonate ABC transporter ATP-binding protein [Flavobacteriales bacterium]|nr:phosphonate ABC transporter ATP-binding protein [Flavobacteriales bacterium]|tara:strand:+ start:81365 stop:82060 length:696 start_codon:yes stop_codon:yes gene_type:complete
MPGSAIIELNSVNVFQKKHLVLSNIGLRIEKGEMVYLVGKNGSGKSSFLKTLYAELKLQEGKGSVAGFDLQNIKRSKIPFLRRKIGIVFQDFQLLSDRTVKNNLKFVMRATGWKNKKEIEEGIQVVLEKVGLGNKGFKMPHELSGGEQQRVAIARALLNDPEIILADEPTGNLDPETSIEIMKLLVSISQNNKAVLVATHDYELIRKFPGRVLQFENETITEPERTIPSEA